MTEQTQWLGATMAGRLVGVQPKTLRTWQEKGQIPGVQTRRLPNGRIQFRRTDLIKFAESLNNPEGK
jgi:DNA-binding transcriptional MerR regulator